MKHSLTVLCAAALTAGCATAGDEAILFGSNANAPTVEELAALAATNKNSIISALSRRVPRVYLRGGDDPSCRATDVVGAGDGGSAELHHDCLGCHRSPENTGAAFVPGRETGASHRLCEAVHTRACISLIYHREIWSSPPPRM